MHDENGFLAAIRQTPADDTARLVFADWLDEQDDPISETKAAFIRLELQMAEAPNNQPNCVRSQNRRMLAAQITSKWLAVMSHLPIEACFVPFRLECPKKWEQLAPAENAGTRHCRTCAKDVVFCSTIQDARTHSANGTPVAISPAFIRQPLDLSELPIVTSTRVAPDEIERRQRAARFAEILGVPHQQAPELIEMQWGARHVRAIVPLRERGRREQQRRRSARRLKPQVTSQPPVQGPEETE